MPLTCYCHFMGVSHGHISICTILVMYLSYCFIAYENRMASASVEVVGGLGGFVTAVDVVIDEAGVVVAAAIVVGAPPAPPAVVVAAPAPPPALAPAASE